MKQSSLMRAGAVLAGLAVLTVAGNAGGASVPDGDWLGFGRSADNMRHSPLTEVTPANVKTLARAYMIDFRKVDPDVRRGEQSYPVAINGQLYVTTNDDNVFRIDGATGAIVWHFKPKNSGLFKNFGIVANRGVTACDGKLFLLTLDMRINSLDPGTGQLIKSVPIADAVPGAGSNYGYSETSTPTCADHRVVFGAAGSEYGTRGFVMAYTTNLEPAWPSPYWTIPPEQQSWRSASRIVGGGNVWTPVTIDASTDTVFFGTGSATPLYFQYVRPGPNPRTDSLIAVDLKTGATKWWQQLISGNQWAYDVSQPPLVYDAKVGGTTRHVVSVASMEGVWYAFDAKTGRPFYQRIKVIDRVEHPSLQPGKPVTVYPSSLGGLNYSPASFDPSTGYVFNAASETASELIQHKLTAAQKKDKFVLGDVFIGVDNGNFGTIPPGWHDHGSISAIDVSNGRRVWKFDTPEPERGGVTTTASGLGFAGGGDGVVRAFDVHNGNVLWTSPTGSPIASGPTVFSAGGREYVAVTVGGTPTSSNGGTQSQLWVYSLGGAHGQADQTRPARAIVPAVATVTPAQAALAVRARQARLAAATAAGARIQTQAPLTLQQWSATSGNSQIVSGHLLLAGKPVSGAAIAVGGYRLQARTDASGRFLYRIDPTLVRRYAVHVVDLGSAKVGGRALTASEKAALQGAAGGFSVGYQIADLRVRRSGTELVITGRAVDAGGGAVPPVVRYTYQLSGTITDANGKPVVGATLVTRTQDRDFWTFSEPSDANGHYTSFFAASDEMGVDPVPLTVQVASGNVSYSSGLSPTVPFSALKSAHLDVQLPASPTGVLPVPKSTSYAGAVYEGLMLGVTDRNGLITPKSVRWPDAKGRFEIRIPARSKGTKLQLWQDVDQFFSTATARPGGPVDLASYPKQVLQRMPQSIASVVVP